MTNSPAADLIAEAHRKLEDWGIGPADESLMRRVADALENAQVTLHYDKQVIDDLTAKLEAATSGGDTMFTSEYVDALRAELAPRVVSTVAELDARFPAGTVMRDANGDVYEWTETGVLLAGAIGNYIARNWVVLPATVLWVGGTERRAALDDLARAGQESAFKSGAENLNSAPTGSSSLGGTE